MPFSNTYANNILDWAFGKKDLGRLETVFIGFSTNDPEADNGAFSELSGGAYHRVAVGSYGDPYPDYINAASGREITNGKQINWTKATANWPDAKGLGLFTTETGGTPFYYCALDQVLSVEAGAVALFDPGALKIKFPATDIAYASATSE